MQRGRAVGRVRCGRRAVRCCGGFRTGRRRRTSPPRCAPADTAELVIAMQTAILVGLAPPDATEESHPTERDQVKPISHGSNYGISAQPKREKRPVPLRRKPGRSFHQGYGDVRACRVEFP